MRVKIGPYTTDIIPVHRWERSYEFWRKPDTCYLPEEEYTKFDKFVFGFFDKLSDFVRPLNRWSNSRKRKVDVHIDGYDVWNAEHTLAMIIHPTLLKLKEVQHGACHVDPEDCPTDLVPTEEPNDENGYVDNTHFDRWNWVLNEMIWAFEQYAAEDDTDQFYHNVDQLEMKTIPLEDRKGLNSVEFNYQKDPTKPKYWRDEEGLKKHHERKMNGLRLFAKYYEALWD